jgi:mRNA interferase ChpB
MVKTAFFDAGDIVRVCLNPTSGREVQGDFRPCLVLSPAKFNRLGTTLVAPITQGGNYARFEGFTVSLMGTGTQTQGVVLINAVKSLDLTARKAVKVETAPSYIVDEGVAILTSILNG